MIEGVVRTALKSLVSTRCFPVTFPQPDQPLFGIWPAIRYTVVSSESDIDICGSDDMNTDDTRVQLDIVAQTHGAVLVLRDQVVTAMRGLNPPAVRIGGGQQLKDTLTGNYRVILEYLFSASSVGSP